jgi:hypothetical protein
MTKGRTKTRKSLSKKLRTTCASSLTTLRSSWISLKTSASKKILHLSSSLWPLFPILIVGNMIMTAAVILQIHLLRNHLDHVLVSIYIRFGIMLTVIDSTLRSVYHLFHSGHGG